MLDSIIQKAVEPFIRVEGISHICLITKGEKYMKKEEYDRLTQRLSPFLRKELVVLWGKDSQQEERILSLLETNGIDVKVERGETTRGLWTSDFGIPVECTRFMVRASDLGRAQKLLQKYNKIINPPVTTILKVVRAAAVYTLFASMALSMGIRWFEYIMYFSIAAIILSSIVLMRRDDEKYLICSCHKCGAMNRLLKSKITGAKCGRCGTKIVIHKGSDVERV